MQVKLAVIQALPKIIEESVRPMEKIESIRIMQVDGLTGLVATTHTPHPAELPPSA